MYNLKKEKGFTLIELLFVVSIIGILASIVSSSLNDARFQARNTAINQEINSWITAIELYKLENGTPPLYEQGAVAIACLGEGTIGTWTCAAATDGGYFATAMNDYIDVTKNPNRPSIGFGGTGVQQMASYVNDSSGQVILTWFLYGDAKCGLGDKIAVSVNTYCKLNLTEALEI